MKKSLLTFVAIVVSLMAQAYDYPYLAFQTSDGTVSTVSVESLSITFSDGQLVATSSDGSQTFTISDLTKMYFSTEGTTAIEDIATEKADGIGDIYDLTGRKVDTKEMKRGIYIIKTSNGTRKVTIK